MHKLIEVENLRDADKLIKEEKGDVVIKNLKNSTRYLGILQIDYIFKILKAKYNNIKYCVIDVGDDHSAVFNAIKLGYKHIICDSESDSIKKLIADNSGEG